MDKTEFFSATRLRTVVHKLPDGREIELRELTAAQRDALITASSEQSPVRVNALLVAMSCPLFDEGDIDALMGLPGTLLQSLQDAALDLNGMKEGAVAEAKNG